MKPVKAFDRVFHLVEKLRIVEIRDSHGIAGFSFYKETGYMYLSAPWRAWWISHPRTLKSISMSYKFKFSHILRLLLSGEKKCRILQLDFCICLLKYGTNEKN